MNGAAKSTWIVAHGPEGQIQGYNGTTGEASSLLEHVEQGFSMFSISRSMQGHQTNFYLSVSLGKYQGETASNTLIM